MSNTSEDDRVPYGRSYVVEIAVTSDEDSRLLQEIYEKNNTTATKFQLCVNHRNEITDRITPIPDALLKNTHEYKVRVKGVLDFIKYKNMHFVFGTKIVSRGDMYTCDICKLTEDDDDYDILWEEFGA